MLRKLLYAIIAIALIVPNYAKAQSKPKRDVSKDRSVIVARQQEQANRKAAQIAAQRKKDAARKRRKTQRIETPKYASYLRINQQSSLSKTISSFNGSMTFDVSTDGKEWSVVCVPLWCRIVKNANSFVLYYDANTSHDDRADWFKVRSDNQEVKIDIKQLGAPLNIHAQFDYGYIRHNVTLNAISSSRYLKVRTKVAIKGAKDQKCLIVASIYDENGKSIKAAFGYSNYSNSNDDVYAATEVIPTSDDEQQFDVNIHLPNNSMKLLKRRNKLRCKLSVYCVKTSAFVSGANYTIFFRAKNKKGKVTTKPL